MKTALISGITGQDGSYLAELLLEKGYRVYGFVRRTSTSNLERIMHILDQVKILTGDLCDQGSINRALDASQPDEVYNLAGMSAVPASWLHPVSTGDFTGLGVTRFLEAIKQIKPDTRMFQASSSEMFGQVKETPQRETTPFHPRSPYAAAKAYGHHIAVNYRESYGLHISCGIMFNHESPRRGHEFVTRKIASTVAKIKAGKLDRLELGSPYPKRDWGYAPEYMQAAWLMLQQDKPDDYVIGTGETHSVMEFCNEAFAVADIEPSVTWLSPEQIRPADVNLLLADSSKAASVLGWQPQVTFKELVKIMVEAEIGNP